jgi:hypothetical protein
MKRQKTGRQRVQVTCRCHAYHFPHRLGGGRCTAELWVESYQLYIGTACVQCMYNVAFPCEVAKGIESIKHCEGYLDYVHRQLHIRLPMSEQDLVSLYAMSNEEH